MMTKDLQDRSGPHTGVLVISHQALVSPQGGVGPPNAAQQMGKGPSFTRVQKPCVCGPGTGYSLYVTSEQTGTVLFRTHTWLNTEKLFEFTGLCINCKTIK